LRLTKKSRPVAYLCVADPSFSRLYSLVGSISYTLYADPYAFIVHEIIEQMLSKKAANAIAARLMSLCRTDALKCPAIRRLSVEQIRSIGVSGRKAESIYEFTRQYNPAEFSAIRPWTWG
jgi:DNA-3-methyladenine glycosylase II